MKNYLIIGQGVAGSTLAYHLMKGGARVLIIDHHHHESSSVISAGILNPISGKRFALVPEYQEFYNAAQEFYQEMEKLFSEKFFEPTPIIRVFRGKSEQTKLNNKIESGVIEDYLFKEYGPDHFQPLLKDDLGSVEFRHGGVCQSTRLMEVLKEYFTRKECLVKERFYYDDVGFSANGIMYQGEHFDKVIFCEGYKAQYNPWFQHLRFNSAKGEVLRVRIETRDLPRQVIIKGAWLAPYRTADWVVGGSQFSDELDGLPTADGHDQIIEGLKNTINANVTVLGHQAAVRPFLNHQNPIFELHPRFPQMAIFNGLGAKGFLVAPRLAHQFAQELLQDHSETAHQQLA